MLTLHALGRAYGRPPSSWVDGLDELEAIRFDAECLRIGAEEEERERRHREAVARIRRH